MRRRGDLRVGPSVVGRAAWQEAQPLLSWRSQLSHLAPSQQLIYARPAYGTGRVTRWMVTSYNPHESPTRQEGDRVPSLPCRGVPELAAWRINTSLRSHTCPMHPDDTHLPTLLGPVRGTWGFTAGKTSKFLLGTTPNSNPSHSKGNHQHDGKATYRTGGNTCKSFI